jgi:hypothetical protein
MGIFMKIMRLFIFWSIFLMLGCIKEPRLQNTSVPFDSKVLLPYAEKGKARITGQAFLKTAGGDVKVAAGNSIELWPATDFVREIRRIKDAGLQVANLTTEHVQIMRPYIRESIGDAQGGFEFADLPAGEYMLETYLTWKVPGPDGLYDTGGVISAFVTVSDGESKRVMLTH